MSNSLYNLFNRPNNDMLSQFNQFRNMFTGDPKQRVQELLNSGQMTQEQFNQLSHKANQLRHLLPR